LHVFKKLYFVDAWKYFEIAQNSSTHCGGNGEESEYVTD
jgi:hypothetical protein